VVENLPNLCDVKIGRPFSCFSDCREPLHREHRGGGRGQGGVDQAEGGDDPMPSGNNPIKLKKISDKFDSLFKQLNFVYNEVYGTNEVLLHY
jgi:hypothetical protein